ncbi:regulator of sigma E protease [Trypanosoma cruzi]|nr:regulator of sigma E protease [Trypanosoma cruzi]
MQMHAEAPQCRMHGSTEMCLLRVPRIRRVGGSVSRHHEEGSSPGIPDKYSPLQIAPSISLISSTGSVMGQLSIGRFADISWILPRHQPLEYRSDAQRLAGTPNAQSMWEYSLMFGAEQFLCIRRRTQSVPSTHPSRGAATGGTPASSRPHRHPAVPCHQCRRNIGAPSQPSRHSLSPPSQTAP